MRILAALAAIALPLHACVAPTPHPRAVEQVKRGYAHLAAGDRERAEVAFEHALEMAPDLAEARNGLGVALRSAGRPGEALAQYDEAISADPDLAEAHANRGEALAALGLGPEAEEALGDSLRIDPDLVPARIDRARLLARRAEGAPGPEERDLLLRRARRDLLHALEGPAALAATVRADLGWVAWLAGDLPAAAASYDEAARIDPRLVEARVGACATRALGDDCAAARASCLGCLGVATPGSPAATRCAALLDLRADCRPPGREEAPVDARRAPARTGAPR